MSKKLLSLSILLFIATQSSARIVQITSAGIHTCALDDKGNAYCWGKNDFGQLGVGTESTAIVPKFVQKNVRLVKVNRFHTCFVNTNNELKCWGDNTSGSLGLGIKKGKIGTLPEEKPENLPSINLGTNAKIQDVYLGVKHTCVLFEEGNAKCWGSNKSGELGLGISEKLLGLDPKEMGTNLAFINLGTGAKIRSMSLGTNFSCATLMDGAVKCWGRGGILGNGKKENVGTDIKEMGDALKPVSLLDKAKEVTCGSNASCALLENGWVQCWGENRSGVLGTAKADKEVWGDEESEIKAGFGVVDLGGLKATQVSCGNSHCCAILENQALKCWGNNELGQLGLEDLLPRGLKMSEMGTNLRYVNLGAFAAVESISIGTVHGFALLSDGTARSWGINSYGQLGIMGGASYGGQPGTMGDNLPPIELFP